MFTTNADSLRTERAPLYHHYQGQTSPQPAVLILTCENKTLTASVNGIIGQGTHMEAWLGRDREFRIPNTLTGQEIADLLASKEVQDLTARICAGYSEDWSNGDRRGVLNEDAKAAEDELARHCEALEGSLVVWNGDWLGEHVEGLTATSTDEEIAALAAEFQGIANSDGVYLDFDMVKELERRRQILRDEVEGDDDA